MNHTELHILAAETLKQINAQRNLIEKVKDQLVQIEKDPTLTPGHKRMFIEQFQEQLNLVRETKRLNVENYAAIMQQLNQPILDSMAVGVDGEIINL